MLEVLILIVFVLAIWKFVGDDKDDEIADPLDLARPSVERLQAEAERALEELRALGRNGE